MSNNVPPHLMPQYSASTPTSSTPSSSAPVPSAFAAPPPLQYYGSSPTASSTPIPPPPPLAPRGTPYQPTSQQMPVPPPPSQPMSQEDATNALIAQVRQYAAQKPLGVAILTPCYGSVCYVNYVTCLMNTMMLFSQIGVKLKIEFCRNDSLVSRARNNLIAKAMSDPSITHMLFIDSDITWSPVDILKLILADKQLVGGLYPIKRYEFEKLLVPGRNVIQEWLDAKNKSQLRGLVPDLEFIQNKLVRYNLNYLSNVLEVQNNLTKVKHLATGFMMIKRETIEKMSRAFPSTKYTDDVGYLQGKENDYAYALFDCGVEDDHYCSEDWLFCTRWTKMGGEVFVDVTVNLNHSGIEDFHGSFIASLM